MQIQKIIFLICGISLSSLACGMDVKKKKPETISVLELFCTDNASYQRASVLPFEMKKEIARYMMGKKEYWYLDKTFMRKEAISSVRYNPSGSHVAIGCDDGKAYIYDLKTGKKRTFPHRGCVLSLSFHPLGNYMAVGLNDFRTCIWHVHKKIMVASCVHSQSVTSVCYSSLGNLASVSWDGRLCIFDERQGFMAFEHGASACSVAFHPSGRKLATGAADQRARVFDIKVSQEGDIALQEIASFSHKGKNVACVCFNPLGTLLATGSDDYKAYIWDIKTKKYTVFLHEDNVNSVCFDSSGKKLLTGSCDGKVRMFDVDTHQQIATLIHADDVFSVCFHPSQDQLATGSMNGIVSIFKKYTASTLEQLLLQKMITTWLLVEKPDQKIVTIKNFLTDVAQKHAVFQKDGAIIQKREVNRKEISKIWASFPTVVRVDIWRTVQYYIKKYGKKEEKQIHKKKFRI